MFNTTELIRLEILKLTLLQHNKKYVWLERGPDEFDCAGLTWYIYNKLLGIDINYLGYGKSTTTKQMTSIIGYLSLIDESSDKDRFIKSIDIGDILFFHRQSLNYTYPTTDNYYPGHCGLYLGNYKFIQASRVKEKVIISDFNKNEYWKKVLVGSKDILK